MVHHGAPHVTQAQRAKYIDMKNTNPALRMRAETHLGPRTVVSVHKTSTSTLQRPESMFVELKTFRKDFPDRQVEDSEIVWEQIDGLWTAGVTSSKCVELFCMLRISSLVFSG